MTQQLFVYGTLRRDIGNSMFHLLARHARLVGYGRIRGRLWDLGDYPGVVLSTDDDRWVRGEVYAIDNENDVLARLDEYEGCGPQDPRPHEFERVMCEVRLDDGKTTDAWVYEYKGGLEGKQEIASGDYLERAL
jgi:gamma-glutamylcyclotransferase (GGCT)/AIG2-like uncharacterized protein YtfP